MITAFKLKIELICLQYQTSNLLFASQILYLQIPEYDREHFHENEIKDKCP